MAKKYNKKYAIYITKMLHIWRKSITKNMSLIAQKYYIYGEKV
jgi:hypothetical protein